MKSPEASLDIPGQEFKEILRRHGYSSLNHLQRLSFEKILRGCNTLIVAPTGYGKTEAALFPIFYELHQRKHKEVGIKALYITPLRALNRDIFARMKDIAEELGISLDLRHGDTPRSDRRRISLKPPLVLITTPETFQFLLVGKNLRRALENVEWVIVDELHELMGSKRGLQLTIALERLQAITPHSIVRIALSATVPDTGIASRFISGNRRMEVVEVKEDKAYKIKVVLPEPGSKDSELSDSLGISEDAAARLGLTLDLVAKHRAVLIFANTRDTAEAIGNRISLASAHEIRVHHGSLSREERREVEIKFKKGGIRAVVATSSLELGIDIGHVDLVIQYMSPRQATRLVQRVGRSGHFISRISRGVIIAADTDDFMESIVLARRALNGDLEKPYLEEGALDVLSHQIAGLVLEYKRINPEEIFALTSRAYPYRNITLGEIRRLLSFMSEIGLVKIYREGRVGIGRRTYEYYFSTTMIPDTRMFSVVSLSARRKVGSLDADFVASNLEEGTVFVLGGRLWRVIKVDYENELVLVDEATLKIGMPPVWVGEDLPVPFKVAREVGALRRRLMEASEKPKIARQYNLDWGDIQRIESYLRQQADSAGVVPDDRTILVEYSGNKLVINACIGSRGNETLGMLVAYALSKLYGVSATYRSDPYRVVLVLDRPVDVKMIDDILRRKSARLYREKLPEIIRSTSIYKWKIAQVAARMGLLSQVSKGAVMRTLARILRDSPVEEEAIREIISSKVDAEAMDWLFSSIERGKARVLYRHARGGRFSPFSAEIFVKYARYGYVVEGLRTRAVTRIVKKRLENTSIRMLCLHCGRWSIVRKVKEITGKEKCPVCGSRALSLQNPWEDDPSHIIAKWKRREGLAMEELEVIRKLQRSATLYISYGRRAAMALAGHGVGPHTAARLLRISRNEEELVANILKAESLYARTRPYWN